ncbi:MAG: hypothetical protein AAFR11_01460 [Pseudomonadota bacterium]
MARSTGGKAGNDNNPMRVAYHGGKHGMGSLAFREFKRVDAARFEPKAQKADERPQATADHAVAAVLTGKADRALLPFFSTHSGYVPETVNALARNPSVAIIGETTARDYYCLAIPVEHMRQRDESSFTPEKARRGLALNYGRTYDADGALSRRTDLSARYADQQREQDRWTTQISEIFVSPDAERACSSALANYAAEGVKVRSLGDNRATLRDFFDIAAGALDRDRSVQSKVTHDGRLEVTNTLKGTARAKPVYGVVLPFEEASHNEDLFIVEPEFEKGGKDDEMRFVYVAPRDETPWPDDVKSWANGEARLLGVIPVDASGWLATMARVFVGNGMIAGGFRDQYGRGGSVQRLIVTATPSRGAKTSPTLERLENLLRKNKMAFQSSTVQLGDRAPARLLEFEVESDKRGKWRAIVERMRTKASGDVVVLGGFTGDAPGIEYRGQGRTTGEWLRDNIG